MKKSEIIELIEKLDTSSLAEMYIKDGEFELSLKKAGAVVQPVAAPQHVAAPAAAAMDGHMSQSPAAETPDESHEFITAPIVGTFYRTPSPDSPPYVEEGDEVSKGDTICIIEAMKVMNELEAEFDCRIKRILVENQQMIEYGTPLFEVEKL
ncbi:MAG: acetyl-CoA carboxylase biotin carboxyl carrier protein [Spirochaetia bacterium]|nr:acetyl-CoA carboxylase biotin carboxyl carrier protein [Spirochaetia bacterium]